MPPKTHIIYFQDTTSEFILIKKKLHLIPHLHFVSLTEEKHIYWTLLHHFVFNLKTLSHKGKKIDQRISAMVHKSESHMRLNDLYFWKSKEKNHFGSDAKTDGGRGAEQRFFPSSHNWRE